MTRKLLKDEICQTAEQKSRSCSDRTAPGTDVVVKGWVRTNGEIRTWPSSPSTTVRSFTTFRSWPMSPIRRQPAQKDYDRIVHKGRGPSGRVARFGAAVEVQAERIELYGTADPETYPLQKKGHTLEFLREIAYLRPRTNTFGAVLRIRHAMAYAIHKYFNDRGFFYLHTPLITGSDAEGAGAMFQVTTLDLNNVPRNDAGKVDYAQDFFGKPCNLTVSGQLEGELGALALSQIYTFGPTFRAEKLEYAPTFGRILDDRARNGVL